MLSANSSTNVGGVRGQSVWPVAGSTAPGDLSSPRLAVRLDLVTPPEGSPASAVAAASARVSLCRWQDAGSKAKCGMA